jgi:hypothetical protein
MQKNSIIYVQIHTGKNQLVHEFGPEPYESAMGIAMAAITQGVGKDDNGFVMRASFAPFDDSKNADGILKSAFDGIEERSQPFKPKLDESRDTYILRVEQLPGQDSTTAARWADVMGLKDDLTDKATNDDMLTRYNLAVVSQRAWESLTPSEQVELKRHVETHYTSTRFWNGVHRF